MSTASSSGPSGCPVCHGLGRVDDPITTEGLLCTACAGTGNHRAYRELEAYRLGFAAGMEAMRDAMPQPHAPMGLERLQTVLDGQETEAAWDAERDRDP
jgi:hypothetical protein